MYLLPEWEGRTGKGGIIMYLLLSGRAAWSVFPDREPNTAIFPVRPDPTNSVNKHYII